MKVLLGAVLFVGLFGCRQPQVTQKELVGSWIVVNSPKNSAQQAYGNSSRIILNGDGNFFATDLPGDLVFLPPEGATRLVTGNGVWKLSSREGEQEIQLEFHVMSGKEGSIRFGTRMHISMTKTGPVLFYYRGDPGEGLRIELRKN